MAKDGITLDQKEWRKAVKQFSKGTRFEGAKSLNASMASILFKSPHSLLKKTYRQTRAGINASLKKRGDRLIINMAIAWLEKKGAHISDESVAMAVKKIRERRWGSVRYILAGWVPAARDFGASRVKPPKKGSAAAAGSGTLATEDNLEATAINEVGSEIIDGTIYADVSQTMQDTVDKEAKSLEKAYEKRLIKLANRHSGK